MGQHTYMQGLVRLAQLTCQLHEFQSGKEVHVNSKYCFIFKSNAYLNLVPLNCRLKVLDFMRSCRCGNDKCGMLSKSRGRDKTHLYLSPDIC